MTTKPGCGGESRSLTPRFPTMLRKMWSGGEVQKWLDENVAPSVEPVAFQARVRPWLMECFGAEIAADRMERNHRFYEEAGETVQSLGMTREEAHALVDYTWDRPIGEPKQEVGGVMVTLAALCLANGIDMHAAGEAELARISAPDMVIRIRAKQAAKPKHSPLPEANAQDVARAPEGWRLVPRKSTHEMREAFKNAYKDGSIWTDRIDYALEQFIDAAPAAPAVAPAPDGSKFAAYPVARRALASSIEEVEAMSESEDRGITIAECESMMLVLHELRRLQAIEREAVEIVARAAPAVAPTIPVELRDVEAVLAEGDGIWRSCSGCHETSDGHETGRYPYSDIFKCALGSGCSECGGIGAVWDDTDYGAMADAMAKDMAAPAQAEQQGDGGARNERLLALLKPGHGLPDRPVEQPSMRVALSGEQRKVIQEAVNVAGRILYGRGVYGGGIRDSDLRRELDASREALRAILAASAAQGKGE